MAICGTFSTQKHSGFINALLILTIRVYIVLLRDAKVASTHRKRVIVSEVDWFGGDSTQQEKSGKHAAEEVIPDGDSFEDMRERTEHLGKATGGEASSEG